MTRTHILVMKLTTESQHARARTFIKSAKGQHSGYVSTSSIVGIEIVWASLRTKPWSACMSVHVRRLQKVEKDQEEKVFKL